MAEHSRRFLVGRRITVTPPLLYSFAVLILSCVFAAGFSIYWVSHNNQIWCDIVTEFANPNPPPTTERGRRNVARMSVLAKKLDCDVKTNK